MLASFDLTSRIYTEIARGNASSNLGGQIALGVDGTMYYVNANALSTIDLTTGMIRATAAGAFAVPALSDIGSFSVCPDRGTVASVTTSTVITTTHATTTTTTVLPTAVPNVFLSTFPCASPFDVRLYVLVGSPSGNILALSKTNGIWSGPAVVTQLSQSLVVPVSSGSPNGMAAQPGTDRLYMSTFGGRGPIWFLYFFDLVTQLAIFAGNLTGNAGSGAFFGGFYYYVAQRSDSLRRVSLHPESGLVMADTFVATMTNGAKLLDFGDIDFGENGDLYLSAKLMSNPSSTAVNLGFEFAKYNIKTRVYTMISSLPPLGASGSYNNMARGSDNAIYSFNAVGINNSTLTTINDITGAIGPALLSASREMFGVATDMAATNCVYLDLNGPSVLGISKMIMFQTQADPISLVALATVVGIADSATVVTFHIILQSVSDPGMEIISVAGTDVIVVTYDNDLHTISSTSVASVRDYVSVLRSLTYMDTSSTPVQSTRMVTVTIGLATGRVLESTVFIRIAV